MRARMAIAVSGIKVELREVVLRDKPPELLNASPKATVPVLIRLGLVLDESLEIMRWALGLNDPERWLQYIDEELIAANDGPFKHALDRYKYPHRYELEDGYTHRVAAMPQLICLNASLSHNVFLGGDTISFTDIALFPFIRQFANTDKIWFATQPIPEVHRWLGYLDRSELFASIMLRYPQWHSGDAQFIFP